MKAENFINLKPDDRLVDVHFSGYKLSFANYQNFYETLPHKVHEVKPGSHFGSDHAKVFATHNYLVHDPYYSHDDQKMFYTFLCDGNLYNINYQSKLKKICITQATSLEPFSNSEDKYHYPRGISFTDNTFAVVSDGSRNIFLYESENARERGWNLCHTFTSECKSFILLDSRRISASTVSVLLRLVKANENRDSGMAHFWNELYLLNYTKVDDGWNTNITCEIICEGHMEAAGFEPYGSSIIVISCGGLKLSKCEAEDIEMESTASQKDDTSGLAEEQNKLYAWTQSKLSISAVFNFEREILEQDLSFYICSESIRLAYRGCVLLEGKLGGEIVPSDSKYQIANDKLELQISKANEDHWNELVEGDKNGIFKTEMSSLLETSDLLQSIPSFEADSYYTKGPFSRNELEDCDMGDEPGELSAIRWVCPETQSIKHECDITGKTVLFVVSRKFPLEGVCLRMDVDGILWTFSQVDKKPIHHEATFNAFGYVQASKTSRKFSSCSPSCSYAVVVDIHKSAFFYWQQTNISTDLRNRRTGQQYAKIAKQTLINLTKDDGFGNKVVSDPILGIYADDQFLFILTSGDFFCFVVEGDDL